MDAPWRQKTDLLQGPPGPGKYLNASAQHTPTWTGSVCSFAVSVPGAVVGNPAVVACDQSLTGASNVLAQGQVTAPDTVTILLFTCSGSAPALTGANWTVYVLVQGA